MKFVVRAVVPVHLSVAVDASDEDEAIECAMGVAYLTGFAGNGGTNKLVGTTEENVSLEPGECALEGDYNFKVEVEKA
jgi:hypothetical protein